MQLKALVDTVLKKKPVQSSTLTADEKFDFTEGSVLDIQIATRDEAAHVKVVLDNEIKGEKEWFAYERHVSITGNLSIGVQGADSAIRVNTNLIVSGATTLLGGTKPAYWGRYFSGVDFRGFGEYFRREENNVLRNNGVRVLPIGRFTTRVGGTQRDGQIDGTDQAFDFKVTFGEDYLQSQGGEFYFFLDVEPSDPLSADYYIGWSEAVKKISRKIKVLPCVYLNSQDATTADALGNAMSRGAECHGLWIAKYFYFRKPSFPLPPVEFDSAEAKPKTSVPCPVLLWQYAGEIGARQDLDFNVSNPAIDHDELLNRLVLPNAV